MNPVQAMSRGVDVLVACPGRLLDLAGQGSVDLSHVEILVLDEADRMLDMGFVHDVKKVLARLPAKRQNLLFSATFSKTSPTWPASCCTTRNASKSRRRTPRSSVSSNACSACRPATSARCWRT
jgi:superfamily II DNA/RNA helicase